MHNIFSELCQNMGIILNRHMYFYMVLFSEQLLQLRLMK
jgi:hypothetical protein